MSAKTVIFEPCQVPRSHSLEACTTPQGRRGSTKGEMRRRDDDRIFSNFIKSTAHSRLLYNVVIFVLIMNTVKIGESLPSAENLDSKVKMFLDHQCKKQNQSWELEEADSFKSCGPSHGAGIVKNLGQIPEYKSDDMDQWAKATKREIVTQCEVWPQDRSCQEKTYRLIDKCFEKDQKFIFYFMFALTDVICQNDDDSLFIRFWQDGGDMCLSKHIKTLKRDFSDCFAKTSTYSNADVYRNYDEVMQCFRSQFDDDCFGDGATEVLNEIMAEIKRVYRETSSNSSAVATSSFSTLFLAGWVTFLVATQQRVLQ